MVGLDASGSPDRAMSLTPAEPLPASKIPQDIRDLLSPAQINRLEGLLARPRAKHVLAYRFSTRIGQQHIYFAMMSGFENRSPQRLAAEAQNRGAARVFVHFTALSLIYSGVVLSIWVVMIGVLYMLKSYLGIDLFPELSFLHDWFFA